MISTYIAEAAFVLPLCVAAAAALAAAFGAFQGRTSAVVVMTDGHTDLAPVVWFRGSTKPGATGTSYDPQSRGSTG